MPKILLIIAGSYEQAMHYARENQLSREQWKYVSGVEHLCRFGPNACEVAICGTASRRRDYVELFHIVKIRKFLIRYYDSEERDPNAKPYKLINGGKCDEPRQC